MTNATITLCPRQLQAALILAGKKDVRYYLNGVHVEATEDWTRTSATDGYVAAVQRLAAVNGMGGEAKREFIIPRGVIEQAASALKKAKRAHVLVDAGAHTLELDGVRFPFEPIDGRFPDVRQIMGEGEEAGAAQFNPELLIRFRKAAIALKVKNGDIFVKHRGNERSAEVTLPGNPNFAGVVMTPRIKRNFVAQSIAWPAL